MNTIEPRVAHAPLSRRARLDLATLITAGVASAAFFLLPVWTSISVSRSMNSASPDVLPLTSNRPALDAPMSIASVLATMTAPPSAPIPRPRAVTRIARVLTPTPAFLSAKAETRRPQSRLSRFLLGDGRESVQPFPLADRRPER